MHASRPTTNSESRGEVQASENGQKGKKRKLVGTRHRDSKYSQSISGIFLNFPVVNKSQGARPLLATTRKSWSCSQGLVGLRWAATERFLGNPKQEVAGAAFSGGLEHRPTGYRHIANPSKRSRTMPLTCEGGGLCLPSHFGIQFWDPHETEGRSRRSGPLSTLPLFRGVSRAYTLSAPCQLPKQSKGTLLSHGTGTSTILVIGAGQSSRSHSHL
ncbi:hypothetical protein B0J18DRAFT_225327 [Chaetomium sp. MPI-SDFR-AT-0129]|nr:hypothetical protein B0J18DRAFT_225327 [Chaetomium sp. MPI-SDFR-AT-0129]